MAVHIRLRRTGTTRKPAYRVVVADSRAAKVGNIRIEILGRFAYPDGPSDATACALSRLVEESAGA